MNILDERGSVNNICDLVIVGIEKATYSYPCVFWVHLSKGYTVVIDSMEIQQIIKEFEKK